MEGLGALFHPVFLYTILFPGGLIATTILGFERMQEKGAVKDTRLSTVALIMLFLLSLLAPFFIYDSLTQWSNDELRREQWVNCDTAVTADGKSLTESQCEYFRDVLNGKYSR